MTTSKLPEWPEEPEWLSAQRRWRFGTHTTPGAGEAQQWYHHALSIAALARMEDLMEYAQHAPSCGLGGRVGGFPTPCTCGLSELLAACERKEAGR